MLSYQSGNQASFSFQERLWYQEADGIAPPLSPVTRADSSWFGNSSLDFEVVYYVLTSDNNTYMDIQQGINLALIEHLNAQGIAFAFPTRTVRVVRGATPSD